MSWEVISPDLTNDIKERQKITGTPWLSEYFGQEVYSTIHRIDESPLRQGLIWTGSDDGLIHISQDGGANWENVSIPDAPEYSQIYEIEPSPHDPGTAYVAICNYNTDNDYSPYLFKTTDYGKSWTNLSAAFPTGEVTRTIREDKVRKGMLFVGTETGIYTSLDDGKTWTRLSINLPAASVVDIKIKDNDLVIATNGRGLWIMDDITPLRQQSAELSAKAAHLYPVSDHTRFGYNWWIDYVPGGNPGDKKNYFVQNMRPGLTYYELGFTPVNGERKRKFIDAGDPKPLGVVIYFRLSKEPQEISLNILDAKGNTVRNYTKDHMTLKFGEDGTINGGMNKFVWDMRHNIVTPVPKRPPTAIRPIVKPGTYQAQLTVDGVTETQSFNVIMDPRESYTQEDADVRYAFWMEMYDQVELSTQKVLAAIKIRDEVAEKLKTLQESGGNTNKVEKQAVVVTDIITQYEGAYVSTGRTLAEIINLPATILSKMAFLSNILEQSEGPPTQSMREVYAKLVKDSAAADAEYESAIEGELEKLNKMLK